MAVLLVGAGFLSLAQTAEEEDHAVNPKLGSHRVIGGHPQAFVAPANDMCAGSVTIADGPYPVSSLPITTDVGDATDPGDPSPASVPGCGPTVLGEHGVWYTWTPAVAATYIVETCANGTNADADSILAIFTSVGGCAGPFVGFACGDDAGGACDLTSRVTTTFSGGTTYYILVYHFVEVGRDVNTAQVTIRQLQPPTNDTCQTAQPLMLNMLTNGELNPLALNDGTIAASCLTYLGQVGQVATTAPGADVVYSFTNGGATANFDFRSTHFRGGGLNYAMYVTDTCLAPGSAYPTGPGGCINGGNRNTPLTAGPEGAEEIFCQEVLAGQTVYVWIDRTGTTPVSAPFEIQVTRCSLESEFNNSPANAEDPAGDGSVPPNSASQGCPVEGTIFSTTTFTDIDYFSLGTTYAAGSRLFNQVDGNGANPSSSSASGVNFDERITDGLAPAVGVTYEFDDANNNSEFGGLCPNIAGRILPGGPAYVRIQLATATASAEPYRLFNTIRPPGSGPLGTSAVAETLPDDDTSFPLGDYFYGNVEARASTCSDHPTQTCTVATDCPDNATGETCDLTFDTDFYQFCADKGDQIMVNVDADPTRDNTPVYTGLFLFLPSGPRIYGIGDLATQGTTSSASNAPGATHSATTPFSPAQAVNTLATETGLYAAAVNGQQATATSPLGSGDYLIQASLNCQVPEADMGVDKTCPTTVQIGSDLTYTITVSSAGPNLAAGAAMVDALPAGTTFVSASAPAEWVCDTPAVGDGGVVTCFEAATGCFRDTVVITITVHVGCDAGTSLSNESLVGSGTHDGNSANDSDTCITAVTSCDDGVFCNGLETCANGACVDGPDPACHETNSSGPGGDNLCTDDSCDATTDSCVHSAPHSCPSTFNPCSDDLCNPANGACERVCNGTCEGNAKNLGYWKRLCSGRCRPGQQGDDHDDRADDFNALDDDHDDSNGCNGEALTGADVDCVNNSCTFSGVTTVDQMCAKIKAHGHDRCVKAEAQLLSVLLNTCRCRLSDSDVIERECTPGGDDHADDPNATTTVGAAKAEADALLCNAARTQADCKRGECLSKHINSGEALQATSLRLTKQANNRIQLTWTPQFADPYTASATPRRYRLWRRATSGAPYVQIGESTQMQFVDTHPLGGNSQYEVTPVW